MKDVTIYINSDQMGHETHQDKMLTWSHVSREYARVRPYEDYITISGVVAPTAQPTSLTFTSVLATSMTVSFTASVGGADGYLAIRRVTSSPTYVPIDGTTYNVGDTVGDGEVRHFGAGVTFDETGLTASTTYAYDVFAWNGAVGTYAYLVTSPLEGSQATSAPAFSFANCLHFDPTNDRVDTTVSSFTAGYTKLTVSLWVKFDATSGTLRTINCINTVSDKGWSMALNASNILVNMANGAVTFSQYAYAGYTMTNWNMLSFIYDGSQSTNATKMKFYINLNQISGAFSGGNVPTSVGDCATIMRFGTSNGLNQFLDGSLDECAIWNDSVLQNITDQYNSGNGATPNATNLVRHYKFDGTGTSTVLTDETGNDTGTLQNFSFLAGSRWESH